MKYWYFTFEDSDNNRGSATFANEYFSFNKASKLISDAHPGVQIFIPFFAEISKEAYNETLK